jgi:predicted methyltransferase
MTLRRGQGASSRAESGALSRRAWLVRASGLALTTAMAATLGGCLRHKTASGDGAGGPDVKGSLAWAVAGKWRSESDKKRDTYQHPIETLSFFEIKPDHKVIEMWPGAGYMTEILGPYLEEGGGQYTAALFEDNATAEPATRSMNQAFRTQFDKKKSLYGEVAYTAFGPQSGPLGEPGSVDCVLFLSRIQDWMAAGIAEKAFLDAFKVLKPGGILGIEQHRADIGNVQDPAATSGYVQEPFVRQLADEVGFVFAGSSEINANPKDSKDYIFGVWTLPPQRLTAPRGQSPNPDFDGTLFETIGESDRMTLKFKKPAQNPT